MKSYNTQRESMQRLADRANNALAHYEEHRNNPELTNGHGMAHAQQIYLYELDRIFILEQSSGIMFNETFDRDRKKEQVYNIGEE